MGTGWSLDCAWGDLQYFEIQFGQCRVSEGRKTSDRGIKGLCTLVCSWASLLLYLSVR